MATENNISQMLCLIDDIKQDIPDQKYIDIMNSLTKIHKGIEKSSIPKPKSCLKVGVEYYQDPQSEKHNEDYFYNVESALYYASVCIFVLPKPLHNQMYAIKTPPNSFNAEYEYKYHKIDIEENNSTEELYEQISYLVSTEYVNTENIEIIQFDFKDDELNTDDGMVVHKEHYLSFNAEEYYHRVISIEEIFIN